MGRTSKNSPQAKIDAGELNIATCTPNLQEVFALGLVWTPVFYKNGGETFRAVWNAYAHSEENNRFLASTIADYVVIVKKVAQSFPVESQWIDTNRYLLSVYGQSKRRKISRWVMAAKSLPEEQGQIKPDPGRWIMNCHHK